MAEEQTTSLRPSYGFFEVVGNITIGPNTFLKDQHSKNNTNYTYSRLDLQIQDDDGNTFFLNSMDGFDAKKGRTLYVLSKDGGQIQVSFADRKNKTILEQIDNRSFVSVALTKNEPDEHGYRSWKYENFLAFYDAIDYLSTRLETGQRLRITGQTRYNTYNGETQKNYIVNNIFLLDDTDEFKNGFTFRQNVILKDDPVDLTDWEEKNQATINAHVIIKSKGNFEMLPLSFVIRSTPEKKDTYKRVIDKFLTPESEKVRRINIEGKYLCGYVSSPVTLEDLPDDAKELIEDGLYSEEEVLKMNANRERVDELLFVRPAIIRRKGEKPSLDFSDDEIKLADIEALNVDVPWDENGNAVEETTSETEDDDLSFLEDLG